MPVTLDLHDCLDLSTSIFIDVQPVESEDNIADFFTKPHSKTKFQIAAPRLGIKSVLECKNETSSPHPVEEIIDSAEMKA